MGIASDLGRTAQEGLDIFRSIDVDETEEQVKAGAGVIFWARLHNNATADRFLKVYDGLVADVVVGTTTPKLTIPMEAGSGEVWQPPRGLRFATGIVVAATTGIADNDTGAPGANEVIVNLGYA